MWEHRGKKIWKDLKCLKRCTFQCIKSLRMGFCEEQKSLKSDQNLNSHIPVVCTYFWNDWRHKHDRNASWNQVHIYLAFLHIYTVVNFAKIICKSARPVKISQTKVSINHEIIKWETYECLFTLFQVTNMCEHSIFTINLSCLTQFLLITW